MVYYVVSIDRPASVADGGMFGRGREGGCGFVS